MRQISFQRSQALLVHRQILLKMYLPIWLKHRPSWVLPLQMIIKRSQRRNVGDRQRDLRHVLHAAEFFLARRRWSKQFNIYNLLHIIWLILGRKHAKNHAPDIPCRAHENGKVICHRVFADNKRMIRHLWVRHEDYAEDPLNNVPDIRKVCSICGNKIKRGDNTKRHREEVHEGKKRRGSRKEWYT